MATALLTGLPVLALPTAAKAAVPLSGSASPAAVELEASERAEALGEPVEVTAARTEYTKTEANPDGTYTLTQSTRPQRARVEDGSWRGIDTTLEQRSDGTVGPKSAVVDLAFSDGGSGADLLSMGKDGLSLTFGWPGTLPKPTLSGATATYANVPIDGVDLQLTATAESYREVLVVKTAQAAASPELEKIRLIAAGDGLSVVAGEGGGLRALDADGNPVFRGPAGQMWDSAGEESGPTMQLLSDAAEEPQPQESAEDDTVPGEGDTSAELPVTVGAGAVSVTPDLKLLRGQETVYPVFIDPSVGLGVSEWTKLSSDGDKFWKFDEPKGVGRCGIADGYYCSSTGSYTDRMYFEFGPSNLSGKHVLDATFRAYETWSFNCTPYWVDLERTDNISEGTRWPGPDQLDQMGDRYVSAGRADNCTPDQPNAWIEFNDNPEESDENLASTVRALADGKFPRLTLMLRAKDESEPRAWKRFDSNAELKVSYVHKPGVPSSVGVVAGTGTQAHCRPSSDPLTVTVDTPTVQAKVQTKVEAYEGDEEGDLQAEFVMQRSSNDMTSGTWSQVWSDYKPDSGWIPDGELAKATTDKRAEGGLYRYRARTQSHWSYNGKSGDLFSPYSTWCYLRIDATAPKKPVIDSLMPYTECLTNDCVARGGPSQSGTFAFKPNAADTDVKAYRWRLLTSDADATKQVNALTTNGAVWAKVTPGLPGVLTLSVEASDLQLDKEGRVRWGPPEEFTFKVGLPAESSGRWRFEDMVPGSGIMKAADTATHGIRHDATLVGAAGTGGSTRARRGAGDYSLRLNDDTTDPASQVGHAATATPAVNTGDSFTVSAWAYLTDASENRVVLAAPGESSSAFTLYYSSAYKKWIFNRTDKDVATPAYIRSVADAESPPLKVWTHLAGVFNANEAGKSDDTIQLFVNGRPQGNPVVLASEATSYEPWASTRGMQFGRSLKGTAGGEYFFGLLDEVAVFQDARTPEQIREENQLLKDGVPSNELVAHWDPTISAAGGTKVAESPEDPDNATSTTFPYSRGPLALSGTGAGLTGADATSLVLNGTSGYASTNGPVVDESGSFTVSARVRLNKALLASKAPGYRALVAGQATPVGKESSWSLWVEKVTADAYQWKFGRTAVDATGKVIDTALAPAQEPVGEHEWNTWVDVTGVFDGTKDFTHSDGSQRLGVAQLFVGPFIQQGEEDPGLAHAQQGSGALSVGRGSTSGSLGHYLPGDLAKVRVWTGAMTPDQVSSQIAQPSA